MFKEIYSFFFDLFSSWGVSAPLVTFLANSLWLALLAFLAWLADFLGKSVLHSIIIRVVKRTRNNWDDIVVKRMVFRRIAHLFPALVIKGLFPLLFENYPFWINLVGKITDIYMIVVAVAVIVSLLNAINDIYQTYDISKNKPIRGYIQVIEILVYLFALVLVISILINKNPLYLFTGLGAMMAILVLVFKDPIQGLVAGIQLSSNDMVRIGDWITMSKYGADGDVLEITLATVKVKNFDNTIVSIPTYAMITDSFQNWRGMQESDGRRLKRPVYIDMNSARFVDQELLDRLRKFRLIKDYIDERQAEIDHFNNNIAESDEHPAQYFGRRQTNIGIFRAYIEAYLRNHKAINSDMLLMVRQLQPTEKGLPLELYAFSKTKEWVYYERLQSDIFDHLISIVHEFDLRIFQETSGLDIRGALSGLVNNQNMPVNHDPDTRG